VSVSVEQRPHALRELRLYLFDVTVMAAAGIGAAQVANR
jgi:hypothetical protein